MRVEPTGYWVKGAGDSHEEEIFRTYIIPDDDEVFSYSESAVIYDPKTKKVVYSSIEKGKGVVLVTKTRKKEEENSNG